MGHQLGRTVLASVLVGSASGLRSFMGTAAVLGGSPLGRLVRLVEAGELVSDKLPRTPSRLDPLPLAARALFGALSASLAASRRDRSRPLAAIVGASAALAAARLGHDVRASVSKSAPPNAVALGEDALAATLAACGARL